MLNKPISQGRLAVVDVGNNREIANVLHADGFSSPDYSCMHVMIAQSIDRTQDFLTERNTDCISEERKSCVRSMIMQGREHFMNSPG
jgi:hypothetical protein